MQKHEKGKGRDDRDLTFFMQLEHEWCLKNVQVISEINLSHCVCNLDFMWFSSKK